MAEYVESLTRKMGRIDALSLFVIWLVIPCSGLLTQNTPPSGGTSWFRNKPITVGTAPDGGIISSDKSHFLDRI